MSPTRADRDRQREGGAAGGIPAHHPPLAERLDRSHPDPLWRQLHRDLLDRIGAGEFLQAFPGELELSETYGVSRHTVREALRRMRESGVLDSGRGRGSRLAPAAIEQSLGGMYSLFREMEGRGLEQRSDVIDQSMVVDPEIARVLGQQEDAELFHLERVRRVDGEPFAHDRVWLPADLGRPLLDADFTHAALYDELSRRVGVRPTAGDERINAVTPTPAQRALLDLDEDVACFLLERRGQIGSGPPIEHRVTLVRGDRYALLTTWTPGGVRPKARTRATTTISTL